MTPPEDVSTILSKLLRFGIRPGLERVEAALSALGHPERGPLTFQVVGTNGKGSTAIFIDSILRQAGYRTGRFTSPHLTDIRERITVSGEMISPESFSALVREVAALDGSLRIGLTFFEFLTVMAHVFFRRAGVDCVVLEAGLGGRWDATTVSDPIVTVLTGISLDHEEILGPGIFRIFEEKVAVGRKGRIFVANLQDSDLRTLFLDRARSKGFFPVLSGRDFEARWEEKLPRPLSDASEGKGRRCLYQGRWGMRAFSSGMSAAYQVENVGAAVAAIEWSPLPVSLSAFREGIFRAAHPGRFESISRRPSILLDGAHNPEAMERLLESLLDQLGTLTPVGWFLAVHQDKNWRRMLDLIHDSPLSSQALFFPEEGKERGGSWAEAQEMESYARGLWGEGEIRIVRGRHESLLDQAWLWTEADVARVLVVSGSLYLVGAVRPRFLSDPPPVLFSGNERDRPLSEDA
ncbi:MAG: bifunctional folylpolyglutamate synthase/dihydrofolate synthase [Leptospirillia bacterium]